VVWGEIAQWKGIAHNPSFGVRTGLRLFLEASTKKKKCVHDGLGKKKYPILGGKKRVAKSEGRNGGGNLQQRNGEKSHQNWMGKGKFLQQVETKGERSKKGGRSKTISQRVPSECKSAGKMSVDKHFRKRGEKICCGDGSVIGMNHSMTVKMNGFSRPVLA